MCLITGMDSASIDLVMANSMLCTLLYDISNLMVRDTHLKKIKVVVHRIFKCSELNQDRSKKRF